MPFCLPAVCGDCNRFPPVFLARISMVIAVTMATKASAPNRPPTRAGMLTPLEFCTGSLDSRSDDWIPNASAMSL